MNPRPPVIEIDGKLLRRLTPSELWVLGHLPPSQTLYGRSVIRIGDRYYWDESITNCVLREA